MADWKDWLLFVLEIIKIIIIKLPKMGYAAARSLAFDTVADKHGLDVGELEARCGAKVDNYFN